MIVSYEGLWTIIDSKGISKTQLKEISNISSNILSKLSKNEIVSMETIYKICKSLDCSVDKILTFNYGDEIEYSDDQKGINGTFLPNKSESIHRWYSYMEGYASQFVETELDKLENIASIYDPFAGTGTTLLEASKRNITSYYSETNPFMRTVIETKINTVRSIANNDTLINQLKDFRDLIGVEIQKDGINYDDFGGFSKYFENDKLIDVIVIKKELDKVISDELRSLLYLCLSSIIVESSKMVRRGDLRYAKNDEKKDIQVFSLFLSKLNQIIEDIDTTGNLLMRKTTLLSPDSRNITENNLVDCIITSPPYLNGTNYIRNTKLELKINDFINFESDLSDLHSKGIVAGINNVSKKTVTEETVSFVEPYLKELNPVSYDSRIPVMVKQYFNDMSCVFEKMEQVLSPGGVLVMDIGDSQFAGVHIPTHEILSDIAKSFGFNKYSEEIIRKRKSKNGMTLTQRVMRFKLKKEVV